MKIEVHNINLGFFDLVSKQKIGIEGSLGGTTEIADISNSFFLNSNLSIRSISIKNHFADVEFDNIWNEGAKSDCPSALEMVHHIPSHQCPLNYRAQLTNFSVETIYPFLQSSQMV